MRVGVIGYGAIAQYVLQHWPRDERAVCAAILARSGREAVAAAIAPPETVVSADLDAFLDQKLDLVLECAGHAGLMDHGAQTLQAGVDIITVSSGALAEPNLLSTLTDAAKAGGARLQVAAGAIGGLDILASAAVGGLDQVTYSGRKPPDAWKGTPAEDVADLDGLADALVFFEGSAGEAARAYPKNANVAATVALAGTGMDETRVRLIADPNTQRNTHEIEATGTFGNFAIQIEGKTLPDNPRTSALAAMSVVGTLERRLSPIII